MSEDFIKFLIRKIFEEGKIYRIVKDGEWEERFDVDDPSAIAWHAIKIERIEETAFQEIGLQKIVVLKANDKENNVYGGHLVKDWDDFQTEYARTFTFKLTTEGLQSI